MSKAKRAKTKSAEAIVVPALTARTQFGQILRRVDQNNERFVVGRRGEPKAIIMSVEEYIQLFAPPVPVLEEIWRESKAKGLDRLTTRDVMREIKLVRRERRAKNKAVA